MSRNDRISPQFGNRKPDQLRQLRRPNLSSVISLLSDNDSNPASTKNLTKAQQHQRQVSSIFATNGSLVNTVNRKYPALKKPQLSQKIYELTKLNVLVSNRSNEKTLSSNNTPSQRVLRENKENLQPKNKLAQMPILKRVSSRSHHEHETENLTYNIYAQVDSNQQQKKSYKGLLETKEKDNSLPIANVTQIHSRGGSMDTSKKPKIIEIDIVCQEKPKPLISDENCGYDEETIFHLYKREQVYQITPNYEKIQPQITSVMRAVLIDWLVEVCKEFTLKRETLHLAVHNFDRFMARQENVPRNELQLYGIASIYVACKIEEIYPPKVSDFSQASNYGFTNQQILKAEQDLCVKLKWFLNPPTIFLWSTWYMSQWDLYCKNLKKDKILTFKQPNQQSYSLFRQFMNLLDCSLLDLRTFQYTNREIVATLLFLLTSKQFLGTNLIKLQDFLNAKPPSKDLQIFKGFFGEFLQICFGFNLQHLNNCLKYMTGFITLEMVIDQPGSSKIPQEKEMEVSQTINLIRITMNISYQYKHIVQTI